ncbi:unnamed protein product [Eruca vesicaria subsp. sativa]|uniref:F-box domain-containing protein n=1 Tax=Eruca vesicaria subsp. sativa TaxID=29727 RepID=A0ABC8IYB4_ERUVS|nr:unnamed protein product [Eruca vesicaria subsp. sativa]
MEKRETRTKDPSVSQCSQTDWIPFDLAREILMRLPAASLMRFRCVSKQWVSIISDPDFIISFTAKSRSYLLLNFRKNDNQLFFSLSQHKNLEICLPNVETYPLTLLKEDSYASNSQFQSVHGLISFNYLRHVVIWNPSTRQHVTFRKPHEKPFYIRTYLGYDPIGTTYKVLSMALFSTKSTHVLTLGDQESWRPIKDNIPRRSFPSKWICINGVLYFFVSNNGRAEILSFDVRTEKFKLIQCVHDDLEENIYLVNYKNKLARVISKSSCYELWILEEAEKDKWSRQDFYLPFSPHDYGNYGLTGVTDSGEFIYVSVSWHDKNIHVSFYDPKGKSNRIIKIERFEDEDFWLQDEWREHNWGLIGCIPNHIENLICVKNFNCIPSV